VLPYNVYRVFFTGI